ncbi:MAG TPA: MarR family transcriptional regulator [Candidatus Nanoarchaeia archaeon]|nr:MarR family transcriptional regulator [Candidatus Nanoarchaeia archaeon]
MENKYVGYLLIAISALVIVMIVMFNLALKDIINDSCSLAHGDALSCPMIKSVNDQTYIAFGVVGLLIIVALLLIYTKPTERLIVKKIKEKQIKKEFNLTELKSEEKEVFNIILKNKAIFQSDLIEQTRLGKAKMTRIIDRLEGKGFVERKRRGMTNVVVIKE